MIARVVLAAIVAAFAWLLCVFVGGLLALTGVPIAVYVGKFLVEWAVLISVLVFGWYFFTGSGTFTWPPAFTRRS